VENVFSTIVSYTTAQQLTVTRARPLTASANCDIVVGLLTGNSTMDIAAKVTLLLPCHIQLAIKPHYLGNHASQIKVTAAAM